MTLRWLILPVLAAACASAGPDAPAVTTQRPTTIAPNERLDLTQRNVVNTVDFTANSTDVWNAILEAHQTMASALTAADEKAGTLRFQLESRTGSLLGKYTGLYIDCAMGTAGPRVNTHRVTIRITHTLASGGAGQTRMMTLVEATARNPAVSADALPCNSTGRLESEITGRVAARLKQ